MVTIADLEAKLGRVLTGADRTRAQSDLDDTHDLAAAYGLVSNPLTAGQRVVIRRVAARAFRNPAGVRQESVGARSVTYAGDDAKPGVYFTAQDVADMRGSRSGVYSARLTTPRDHLL